MIVVYFILIIWAIEIPVALLMMWKDKKMEGGISINDKLINELYEMSDRYSGRASELLMLAVAEIQRQDLTIEKLNDKLTEKE